MSEGEGFGRQLVQVVSGRALVRLSQFILLLVLARALSPSEFGVYGLITTLVALGSSLGTLGLRQAVALELGKGRVEPRGSMLTLLVLWVPLAAVAMLVVVRVLGMVTGGSVSSRLLALTALALATAMLLTLLQGGLLGLGFVSVFAYSDSSPKVVLLCGCVALALFSSLSLDSVLIAQVVAYAFALPICFVSLWRVGGDSSLLKSEIPRMLRYGFFFAGNLALITLLSRIPIFFLVDGDDTSVAGSFFAGARISEALLEIAAVVGLVVFSRTVRGKSDEDSLSFTVDLARRMFWMFAFLGMVVGAVAPVAVPAVVGPGYDGIQNVVLVLALGLPAAAASKVIYPALAGMGRALQGTPVLLFAVAVNVALSIAIVPNWGVVGGAVALVVSQYTVYIGYVLLFKFRFHVDFVLVLVPNGSDKLMIVTCLDNLRLRLSRSRRVP